LQELRRILREQRDDVHNIDQSAQLLFKPLEPFLVDDHQHPGRVARSSLEALWNWVRRDLLPDDANSVALDVGKAMLDGDQAKIERLTRIFQDRVAAAIEASYSAAAEDGSNKSARHAQPKKLPHSNALSKGGTFSHRLLPVCHCRSVIWPMTSSMNVRH
jgi:hypothetical protein